MVVFQNMIMNRGGGRSGFVRYLPIPYTYRYSIYAPRDRCSSQRLAAAFRDSELLSFFKWCSAS